MPSKLMHRLSPGGFRRAAEGAQRDPATMARATVYFFTAGATLGLVDILVRTGGEASLTGQVVSTAATYAIAAFVLLVFDRLPPWVYGALIALGTAGVYFGDAGTSALVLLYCWVALYAGHFPTGARGRCSSSASSGSPTAWRWRLGAAGRCRSCTGSWPWGRSRWWRPWSDLSDTASRVLSCVSGRPPGPMR